MDGGSAVRREVEALVEELGGPYGVPAEVMLTAAMIALVVEVRALRETIGGRRG